MIKSQTIRCSIIINLFILTVAAFTTYYIFVNITEDLTIDFLAFLFLFIDICYEILNKYKPLEKYDVFKFSFAEEIISMFSGLIITCISAIIIIPLIKAKSVIYIQTREFQSIDVIIVFLLAAKLFHTFITSDNKNPTCKNLWKGIKHSVWGYTIKELQ